MDGKDSRDYTVAGKIKTQRGSQEPGRPDPGKLVLVVNGVIAAVGGTYASTHSLAATVVACCVGVACAVLLAWRR
jgi:hypothetical protein